MHVLSVVCLVTIGLSACSEAASPPPSSYQPPALLMTAAECGVSYTSITTMTDSAALAYGAPAVTDTANVCETWTGSDYTMQVTQTGSSEPVSEYSEDVKTVLYTNGQTTPYAADNTAIETGSDVGTTSFDFGQATASEQQASYNDPYYGIAQDSAHTPCPGDPTAIICNGTPSSSSRGSASVAGRLAANGIPLLREHHLQRKALRALMSDKEEILPSIEGFRRFRSVIGDQELILGVDPVTELIRTQETNAPDGHVMARLSWRLENGRFIRHRMEIDSDESINGKTVRSFAVVSLTNVRFVGGGR